MVVTILKEKGYNEGNDIYEVFYDYYSRNYLKNYVISYIDYEIDRNEENDEHTKNLQAHIVFPMIVNAMFLTMYSDFEYFLLELSKRYKKELDLKLSPSDLKGEGIINAFNYLDKVVNIKDVKVNRYYQDLPHWNRIRNYLIHNSAIIDGKCIDSVQRLNIKTAKSLGNDIIMMDIGDCKRFIDTIENLQKYLIFKRK